jgi:hypothetical protein
VVISGLRMVAIEARRMFSHDIQADPRVGRLGKRLDDRKVRYPFWTQKRSLLESPGYGVSNLPGFRLSSEKPNRQAFAVHFGRLEDRNAPRIRYPFLSWGLAAMNPRPSAPHIQRHPCVKRYIHVIRQR